VLFDPHDDRVMLSCLVATPIFQHGFDGNQAIDGGRRHGSGKIDIP
jgi:hypothetical protein